jgi:cbb3-type cytochrome c oxidase subunit III
MLRRLLLLAAAALLLAACGSTKTVTVTVATTTVAGGSNVSALVAEGAHTFNQFACAQCHGPNGSGGVSPSVPALKIVGKAMTPTQLRTIIDHGLGQPANSTKPYMPVWGQVISARQVTALIAYLNAGLPSVAGATAPPVQTDQGPVVEGAQLYVRYGCVNCHGPNGLGGVPNPVSEDKTIPPLSGADFFTEFNTDQKIIEVIRSGSVLGRAPIVSMPHWGGILTAAQLHALAAYIKTLKHV